MLNVNKRNSILLGLCILICFSRGLLQIVFPKSISFGIQFSAIILLVLITVNIKKISVYLLKPEYILISIITFFSMILTQLEKSNFGFVWVGIVLVTLLLLILTKETIAKNNLNYIYLKNITIVIFIILILFGTLQSNGLLLEYLPADNSFLNRPSSITSSYLHYPIVISTLSIIFLHIFINSKRSDYLYLVLYLVGFVVVFIANSRYGMLQVIIGLFLIRGAKKLAIIFLITLIVLYTFYIIDSTILDRLFGSFSIDSIGNNDRVNSWNKAVDQISILNIFLGSSFGLFSNSTNIFSNPMNAQMITESSMLLLFLNFGIIGGIYYMYLISRVFSKQTILFIILIFPTLFYQSIEVIPFILIICLAPVLIRMENGNGSD